MKHKIDVQTITLDFWLNRLLIEKYGMRISGRIVNDKIYLFWWKGSCEKGNWLKIGQGKFKAELILPSPKEIEKAIDKRISKSLRS